ncbi:MAG: putative sporulation protein YtxC [Clostridiales bacterium]|nr:putative sporulation protein YtxC [Clostridiales bacterium]
MMQFLNVGLSEGPDEFLDYLSEEADNLEEKGFEYKVAVDDTKDSVMITLLTEENYDSLKKLVCCTLASYIIKKYEERILGRIINSHYFYFNNPERKNILKLALSLTKKSESSTLGNLFLKHRKKSISEKLNDFFESSNSVILDGFVNFRLKDYIKDMEEIVDKAVDEYLMEREYKEFIKLLRYFVDIQEPKYSKINVMSLPGKKYMLFDEEGREITEDCICEFMKEIKDGEINQDDLLVSSLITMSPKNIIIHNINTFSNKELLETIRNVFSDKIIICEGGCSLCLGSNFLLLQ